MQEIDDVTYVDYQGQFTCKGLLATGPGREATLKKSWFLIDSSLSP